MTDPGPDELQRLCDQVDEVIACHRYSAPTQEAMGRAWRRFTRYCTERGVSALPADPATLTGFVAVSAAARADGHPDAYGHESLRLALNAIRRRHVDAGLDDPTRDPGLLRTLAASRAIPGREHDPHLPATPSVMRRLVRHGLATDTDAEERTRLARTRNKAAWLLAWHKGLEPHEWLGLRLNQVVGDGDGYRVEVPAYRGAAPGRVVSRRVCHTRDPDLDAVTALDAWLPLVTQAAHADEVPAAEAYAFCAVDGQSLDVTRAPDRAAMVANFRQALNRANLDGYSQRSLVTGFAVTALDAGIPWLEVLAASRFRSSAPLTAVVEGRAWALVAQTILDGTDLDEMPGGEDQ